MTGQQSCHLAAQKRLSNLFPAEHPYQISTMAQTSEMKNYSKKTLLALSISINYFTDKTYMATRDPYPIPPATPFAIRVESDVHSPATLARTKELTVLKNKRRSVVVPRRLHERSGGEK